MRVTDPRDHEKTLELEIKVTSYGSPASWTDPAEGPELEISKIWDEDDKEIKPADWERVFTPAQLTEIETEMYESWEPDERDYDDGRDFTPPYEP